MKKSKWYGILIILIICCRCRISVHAGTIHDSPYVSFSPDGQAWTTNAGDRNIEWYEEGGSDDVVTGVKGSLRDLRRGEHYYAVKRNGTIPVSRWEVYLSKVVCCHNTYPDQYDFFGVKYNRINCYRPHFSGWRPICADCGGPVAKVHFYMSRKAAKSLSYLEAGNGQYYYYLCPFDNNLEQGAQIMGHQCRDISANRYRVVYDANAGGEAYGGYMAPSFHMYDNAVCYEGREVTPQTNLTPNVYTRIGWVFAGWNTEPDGLGTTYMDREEIRNLCEGDFFQDEKTGTITLYALWRPAEGILEIDPGGGKYAGSGDVTSVPGKYGESYGIDMELLEAPRGYRLHLETEGGKQLEDIQGTQHFSAWHRSSPFLGKLRDNLYSFPAADQNTDHLLAAYLPDSILLPEPERENFSFGGWYYDRQYTRPAGGAGTEFLLSRDVTLYAQWVDLLLVADNDYETDGGAGAVNLFLQQADGKNKSYKLYQSRDGKTWEQIYEAGKLEQKENFYRQYTPDAGQCETGQWEIRIPYTGLYWIEACGAQGEDFGDRHGGRGGVVKGMFWLGQGEKLTIEAGSCNGEKGGEGNPYGNGGGYSSVKSSQKGILLIAGGGGGAGICEDGGLGGADEGLLEEESLGEDGAAGGGGGFRGGRAGEAVVHDHIEGVCNHVHQGDPSKKGGCYTKPVKCGEKLTHVLAGTRKWYWGGLDEEYCPNCGSDQCTGHEEDYYDHKCPIHGRWKRNSKENSPKTCGKVVRYEADCGRSEEYFCGYQKDGEIISSLPSYGGSNFFNTEAGELTGYGVGEWEGAGQVILQGLDLGYLDSDRLNGVSARDRAAPDDVSQEGISMLPMDGDRVLVAWNQPKDNGTLYFHRAESYLRESSVRLSVSNITSNTLVSGVRRYLYRVDENPDTIVESGNAEYTEEAEVEVGTDGVRYLHLAAEDVAGNLSGTIHIAVGEKNRRHEVAWPIYTEPLSVEESESVYRAGQEKTYYVRCDGQTPFTLKYSAYIQGRARADYQPNHAIVETGEESGRKVRHTVHVPSCDVSVSDSQLSMSDLSLASDGEGILTDAGFVTAKRSLYGRRLSVTRMFCMDGKAHGKTVSVLPVCGVDCRDGILCSEYQRDVQNGICLIGDGEAPEISGLESLEGLPVLDKRDGGRSLRVTVLDDLSGVREWSMQIENLDNGCLLKLTPDEEGVIEVDITEDIPLFSGDFTVTVRAVDNVGNERTLSAGTTEFGLQAKISRVLEPHTPLFKRGESALLEITSWGYADRVEVEFPWESPEGDGAEKQEYVYEQNPMYRQEESFRFMIPLYVPQRDTYQITVRAYKGDKMLETYPEFAVLEIRGTVLDELRTRLR